MNIIDRLSEIHTKICDEENERQEEIRQEERNVMIALRLTEILSGKSSDGTYQTIMTFREIYTSLKDEGLETKDHGDS